MFIHKVKRSCLFIYHRIFYVCREIFLIKIVLNLFFSISTQIFAHHIEKHSNPTTKIEDSSNFDSVIENLMTNQIKQNEISQNRASTSKRNNQAVARKSTTKSVVSYSRPGPRVFKAVARKSTNPLPKYRSSLFTSRLATSQRIKTESEKEETSSNKSCSYYGITKNPVNLSELNTYMIVGGHSMRVNCLTLATLININPKVMLKDIKKDPRYTAIFPNFNFK